MIFCGDERQDMGNGFHVPGLKKRGGGISGSIFSLLKISN